ncbi:hypothetical protein J2W36_004675 [Variovorax ginsengisoli]|uniref:Uncharacterized protein n=1 Tax=Variovorax ginsengisoli TaxID=363844 RepID=A0ABT9SDF6_9BURK|nr:hypothetical protein [Variovorax ginsengisoli]
MGGADAAQALVRAHPDEGAFRITPDPDGIAGTEPQAAGLA